MSAANKFQEAQRKARYGHKTYLYWRTRDGQECVALYSKANIKRAILDVGTQGHFLWLNASTGISNICRSFSYALHLLKCAPSIGGESA